MSSRIASAALLSLLLTACPSSGGDEGEADQVDADSVDGDGTAVGTDGAEADGDSAQGEVDTNEGEVDPELAVVSAEEGGVVALGIAVLQIPPGALGVDTGIELSALPVAVPGFDIASDVFAFGPSGTEFLRPIRVAIPFLGDPRGKVVFLSKRDGSGFEPVPTEVGSGGMFAFVTHFSEAFVGADGGAACADVVCDATIPNTCDGDTATVFGRGTCVGGECVHAAQAFDCALVPGGTGDCVAGTCVVTGCDTGREDCDGEAFNGCEVNLQSDEHCGSCQATCEPGRACNVDVCDDVACVVDADCGSVSRCVGGPAVETFPLICDAGICVALPSTTVSCGAEVCADGQCQGCRADAECDGVPSSAVQCEDGVIVVSHPVCERDAGTCSRAAETFPFDCSAGCANDLECPPGASCSDALGMCVDGTGKTDCRITGCEPGFLCAEEAGCVEDTRSPCEDDADCPGVPERCIEAGFSAGSIGLCLRDRCTYVSDEVTCNPSTSVAADRTFCVDEVDGARCLPFGDECVVEQMPCGADGDCGNGGNCVGAGGRCSAVTGPCTSDDDCGGSPGSCQAPPGVCALDSAPCQSDADCENGGGCVREPGECLPEERGCAVDTDCAPGSTCTVVPGRCEVDAEQCGPSSVTCTDGTQLVLLNECQAGHCGARVERSPCGDGPRRCDGARIVAPSGICDVGGACGFGSDVVVDDCADDVEGRTACLSGACVWPGSTCASAEDCGGERVCDGNRVIAETFLCEAAASNLPSTCISEGERTVATCPEGCSAGACLCDQRGQPSCSGPDVCIGGVCSEVSCATDADCPDPSACFFDDVASYDFGCSNEGLCQQLALEVSRVCEPGNTGACSVSGNTCFGALDCPDGESCVFPEPTRCIADPAPACLPRGDECVASVDCRAGDGLRCEGERLVGRTDECIFGYCDDGPRLDQDCAATSELCDLSGRRCAECLGDGDCDAASFCVDGACWVP